METIPITSLAPTDSAPPADKAIRAVVTLLWPYSSSTKQCALLLADPDFRLRHRKGQVRVRFTSASAEAIANGRVGIGDEVVLELRGASWAEEAGHVATPGRSVDGELVYKGELGITVLRKASGEEVDARINVNQDTPPPDEQELESRRRGKDIMMTPARATPSYLRTSLGGADVVPIYSSPAFMRRARLSSESSSWDPFQQVDNELEEQPRKKQRISFGGFGRWKAAERTPSPEKEDAHMQMGNHAEGDAAGAVLDAVESSSEFVDLREAGDITGMLPPPLPKLQMPDDVLPASDSDGPSTPKLQPVPSSALPLPSPFPTETAPPQFGSTTTSAVSFPSAQPKAPSFTEVTELETTAQIETVHTHGQASQQPPTAKSASLASTTEHFQSDVEETIQPDARVAQPTSGEGPSSSQLLQSEVEYLSDTEEDEEMYYDHMRRRFPTFDERGYRRVDHQEEGYYDDLSHVAESEADEVIDDMGIEPEEEHSDEDQSDQDELDESESTAIETVGLPQRPEQHTPDYYDGQVFSNAEAAVPAANASSLDLHVEKSADSTTSTGAQDDTLDTQRQQPVSMLKTPAGPPRALFGFDDISDQSLPKTSTPQSERDRVMRKTYSSLFGFKGSPSPERSRPAPALFQKPSPPPMDFATDATLGSTVKERNDTRDALANEPKKKPLSDTTTMASDTAVEEHRSESQTDSASATELGTDETQVVDRDVLKSSGDYDDPSLVPSSRLLVEIPSEPDAKADSVGVDEVLTAVNTPSPQVLEDAVPNGVAINADLGAAISPFPPQKPQQSVAPSASSAPRPSQQVEVIDIASSDNESDQHHGPAEKANMLDHVQSEAPGESLDGFYPQLSQAVFAQHSQSVSSSLPDTTRPSEPTTQHSEISVPQSDMLDTTQTTLDRSEVETPVAQESVTMIPDTLHEDGIWAQPGHQDFFAEQLHAEELPGTQLPLTQNATGMTGREIYQYYSFQSDTSVATDNTENLDADMAPAPYQQSEHEDVTDPEDNRTISNTRVETPPRGSVPSDAIELLSSPSVVQASDLRSHKSDLKEFENDAQNDEATDGVQSQDTAIHHPVLREPTSLSAELSFDEYPERQPDLSFRVSQEHAKVSQSPETSKTKPLLSRSPEDEERTEREAVSLAEDESYVAEDQVLSENETQDSPTSIVGQHRPMFPTLPVSPDESQHQIESQPFETQLPRSVLPPTPQLTQGGSLMKEQPEESIEPTQNEGEDEEIAEAVPVTPRRSQRTKEISNKGKTDPVRRSTRKSHAEPHISQEHAEESREAQMSDEPPTPSFVKPTLDNTARVNSETTTPPMRLHGEGREDIQASEDASLASQMVEDTSEQTTIPETSTPHIVNGALLSPNAKPLVRRSPRKLRADSPPADKVTEEADDTIVLSSTPEKPNQRTSPRKAHSQAKKMTEEQFKAEMFGAKKTPGAKKSFASRVGGNVPDVISNWFSPRRSARQDTETTTASKPEPEPEPELPTAKRSISHGLTTSLAYYTALASLEEKLNPSSQPLDPGIDLLALVTEETSPHERAKTGPKDYFTVFHITDPSLEESAPAVRVEVYRHWHAKLPIAQAGDVVLLRSFAVKSRQRRPYLLSTDSSAWCVWRYADTESPSSLNFQRATRQRSGSAVAGVREEIKGPPVELGAEERLRGEELRTWWQDSQTSGTRAPDAAAAARTRSGRL